MVKLPRKRTKTDIFTKRLWTVLYMQSWRLRSESEKCVAVRLNSKTKNGIHNPNIPSVMRSELHDKSFPISQPAESYTRLIWNQTLEVSIHQMPDQATFLVRMISLIHLNSHSRWIERPCCDLDLPKSGTSRIPSIAVDKVPICRRSILLWQI